MVVLRVQVGKDPILVLQTSIVSDGGVGNGSERSGGDGESRGRRDGREGPDDGRCTRHD